MAKEETGKISRVSTCLLLKPCDVQALEAGIDIICLGSLKKVNQLPKNDFVDS
jgi:hypothetical protein